MKCEICEKREAIYQQLCEHCAEGIKRLASIEWPKNRLSFISTEIRRQECQLMCPISSMISRTVRRSSAAHNYTAEVTE